MKTFKTLGLAILFASTASIAMAQGMDHSNMDGVSMDGMNMNGDASESSDLPEICLENADHMAGMSMDMDMGAMMDGMSEGHQAKSLPIPEPPASNTTTRLSSWPRCVSKTTTLCSVRML